MLQKEGAWSNLSEETRQQLYSLLPTPEAGEATHDKNVNPLDTALRPHVEEALRVWQEDLTCGKHGKKWREEAMNAGKDRKEGKFDEAKEADREQYWGTVKGVENVRAPNETSGNVKEAAGATRQAKEEDD
ncbi:hypothetical protein BAUCODRAFT_33891 [Baudoinia panamericana UAMH 10762]|uniref:ASX DEUBAD domain-containing protein n=1 Tax=Baudoinia panamericana (strain UAMH 10762) TaxID=717646 RepID=M2LQ54_BAUPA|nr:uncharacterized protein BAUCODRAFT_33891 [Baudoinia panamericana UAMH 10762]EMC96522.1 hypothetical protein BAUCODRAFT_33891 [Baudoinia panamericana UAMH 10762]